MKEKLEINYNIVAEEKFELSSKEILKQIKEFNLSEETIKEILKRKNMKNLMVKELETQLSRSEATIAKNAAYIFNLFILLSEFKSENLVEFLLKIADYPEKFLNKIFAEFISHFKFVCFASFTKNEKLFYEKISKNQNGITLCMIATLTKSFLKTKDKELEKYLQEIALESSKNEMYDISKLILMINCGYIDAEINLNKKRKKIKDLNVRVIIEAYREEERLRKKQKKSRKILKPLKILEIYSAIKKVNGNKNYYKDKEKIKMKLEEAEFKKILACNSYNPFDPYDKFEF